MVRSRLPSYRMGGVSVAAYPVQHVRPIRSHCQPRRARRGVRGPAGPDPGADPQHPQEPPVTARGHPRLQPGAEQAGAGHPHPCTTPDRGGVCRCPGSRAPAAVAHVGHGAQLGQGHQDRHADDQRAIGVGPGEGVVRQGRGLASLSSASPGLVRVAEVAGEQGRQGQPAQATLLHAPGRRGRRRVCRALRVLARP